MVPALRPAAWLAALLSATVATAQSAPPLTALQIAGVTSATQAERIAPGQLETARHHAGAVTLVVLETGIGSARLLRLDGRPITPPSTLRPLCGAAVTAGACRPGAVTTGIEITYHLGPIATGQTLTVQDTSANLPATTLTATLTFR